MSIILYLSNQALILISADCIGNSFIWSQLARWNISLCCCQKFRTKSKFKWSLL